MQTHTLVSKDPNHTSVVAYNIEATIIRTDATIQNTHMFGDDRQLTADDCIQEQQLASTKNKKGTKDHVLILNKTASHNDQS